MQVFKERHGYEALQKKRKAKAVKVENIFVSQFFLVVTGKRGGEEGEGGGVGEVEGL